MARINKENEAKLKVRNVYKALKALDKAILCSGDVELTIWIPEYISTTFEFGATKDIEVSGSVCYSFPDEKDTDE